MNNKRNNNQDKETVLKLWSEYYYKALSANIGFPKDTVFNTLVKPKVIGFISVSTKKTDSPLRERLIQKTKEQLSVDYVQNKHFFVFVPKELLGGTIYGVVEIG
ncbi:unnamed protein product [marine sediment metagenome]|uniref:Uncharacterized protein n=1 Tax=marine sediment metagenome TaxID=412755 RepID=X1BFU1_9ZZZZ